MALKLQLTTDLVIKSNIPEYVIKGNKSYKVVSNHLGSPVMVIDMSDNSVVKEIKYDSFGNILLDSDPNFKLPFRFAGEVSDSNVNPVRHQKPAELPIWEKDTKLVRFGVRELQSNLRSSGDLKNTFSSEDCNTSNSFGKPMYLATQKGQVYRYTPNLYRIGEPNDFDERMSNSIAIYDPYTFGDIMRLPDLDCKCPKKSNNSCN